MDGQLAKLPEQVLAEVTRQTGQIKSELMPEVQQVVKAEIEALKSDTAEEQKPAPAEPPAEPQPAIQTPPASTSDEQSAETPDAGSGDAEDGAAE